VTLGMVRKYVGSKTHLWVVILSMALQFNSTRM